MINEISVKRYCKDFTKIENYEKAIADMTRIWECHHRLETHNSDGERRLVDLTGPELIALDMYFDRPPEELIFLTRLEHRRLHNSSVERRRKLKGKYRSEETKKRISEAKRGHSVSEETRKKISEANRGKPSSNKGKPGTFKGKHHSEETKRKMSEARKGLHKGLYKGKHWKLVDGKRVWY